MGETELPWEKGMAEMRTDIRTQLSAAHDKIAERYADNSAFLAAFLLELADWLGRMAFQMRTSPAEIVRLVRESLMEAERSWLEQNMGRRHDLPSPKFELAHRVKALLTHELELEGVLPFVVVLLKTWKADAATYPVAADPRAHAAATLLKSCARELFDATRAAVYRDETDDLDMLLNAFMHRLNLRRFEVFKDDSGTIKVVQLTHRGGLFTAGHSLADARENYRRIESAVAAATPEEKRAALED